jgi:predicted dehydrogenase
MVNLGIIGLGPDWDTRYRPALAALRSRVRMCAVYDRVPNRAVAAAAALDADPVGGLRALLARRDVRGVLLLDSGWQGVEPLRMAVEAGKPTLIAAMPPASVDTLARLHLAGLSAGLTLMPEYPFRYQPATHRLLELIATQLGKPREIVVEAETCEPDAHPEGMLTGAACLSVIDWCRHIARTPPASVEAKPAKPAEPAEPGTAATGAAGPGVNVKIEFRRPRLSGARAVAELRLSPACGRVPAAPRFTVRTEFGEATLTGPRRIRWSAGNGPHDEELSGERPETEVLIDHFCRRVVGGLVPVPDLADQTTHLRLLEHARHSLAAARPVRMGEHD